MLKRIPNSYYKTVWKSDWTYQFKCVFCQELFYSNKNSDRREGCSKPECRESLLHEKKERAKNTVFRFAHSGNKSSKTQHAMHLHNGSGLICNREKTLIQEIIVEPEILTDIENRPERICKSCMTEYKFFYKI